VYVSWCRYHGVSAIDKLFICVTWLFHTQNDTYMWHYSYDMTLSYTEWLVYLMLLAQMLWHMRHYSCASKSVWFYHGVQCNRCHELHVHHEPINSGVHGSMMVYSAIDDSFIFVTWLTWHHSFIRRMTNIFDFTDSDALIYATFLTRVQKCMALFWDAVQ